MCKRNYYRPNRCPKCGSNRIKYVDVYYSTGFYECNTCKRSFKLEHLKRTYEEPFSHTLWDFKNQEEATLEYNLKYDDTSSWTGKE